MGVEVSVIVPVKDRNAVLRRCIDSIVAQDMDEWEAWIVDDKSEKVDVKSIVESYSDDRLNYVLNHKAQSNANVCRNIGLEKANGRFVAMLDSDDCWLTDHLSTRILFMKENECDGCFGSAIIDLGSEVRDFISRDFQPGEGMADYLMGSGSAYTPTHFYTKESALDTGWDESFFRFQDFDFSIRYAEKYKFVPCKVTSVKIFWENRPVNTNLEVTKRFFAKHRDRVDDRLYTSYFAHQYELLKQKEDVSQADKDYAKSQAMSNLKALGYMNYTMLFETESILQKVRCRLSYALRRIF